MAANITSLGVGSGLDLNTLVNGLMSVERQPLTALNTKLSSVNADISAMGTLKSALSKFQDSISALADTSAFNVFATNSSDTDVATATASTGAGKGSYSISVTRIAENHRMAAATTFANTDTATVASAGNTMTIGVGSQSFAVNIGGKTLQQARDAINNATDNKGVTASIIHDNVGYRLLLSAKDTGSANFLTVGYSGSDAFALASLNTDRNASGSFTAADLDAVAVIEGTFNVTSSSNTLTDAVQGVSITLKSAGSTTLNVERDDAAIKKSADSFASATSNLFAKLKELRTGSLKSYGAMLRSIESQVRGILTSTANVGGSFSSLSAVGLETQRDGSMTVNSTTFTSALQTDLSGVVKLFTDSSNGLAVRLKTFMTNYVQSGGVLESQTKTLSDKASRLTSQQTKLQAHLDLVENRYIEQYTKLDSVISKLQSSSSYLSKLF
ncbi:MAG: flagellar filament capping protein FliD [Gammaproteobacteria bacterium]